MGKTKRKDSDYKNFVDTDKNNLIVVKNGKIIEQVKTFQGEDMFVVQQPNTYVGDSGVIVKTSTDNQSSVDFVGIPNNIYLNAGGQINGTANVSPSSNGVYIQLSGGQTPYQTINYTFGSSSGVQSGTSPNASFGLNLNYNTANQCYYGGQYSFSASTIDANGDTVNWSWGNYIAGTCTTSTPSTTTTSGQTSSQGGLLGGASATQSSYGGGTTTTSGQTSSQGGLLGGASATQSTYGGGTTTTSGQTSSQGGLLGGASATQSTYGGGTTTTTPVSPIGTSVLPNPTTPITTTTTTGGATSNAPISTTTSSTYTPPPTSSTTTSTASTYTPPPTSTTTTTTPTTSSPTTTTSTTPSGSTTSGGGIFGGTTILSGMPQIIERETIIERNFFDKNRWLLIVAIGLGAYLLFRKKD